MQPGHEYTKSNVKFGISVLQSEAVKKLETFANQNKETQGQFTIGDEKVSSRPPVGFFRGQPHGQWYFHLVSPRAKMLTIDGSCAAPGPS